MSEFLRTLEIILDELPRLLASHEWQALQAELMPLVERYRATDNPALVEAILAVLRKHPKAAELLREARPAREMAVEAADGDVAFELDDRPRATARAAPPAPAPPPPPLRRNGGHRRGGVRTAARHDEAAAEATERPAPPKSSRRRSQPRWVLARVFDLSSAERPSRAAGAYRANAEHEIEVMIGEEQADWLVARGPSAEHSLDAMLPPGKTYRLGVAFLIPALGVHQVGTLTLPPTGPTRVPTTFRFTAPAPGTPVEALISVTYRGRILQSVILSGVAVADPAASSDRERLRLRLQVVVPGFGNLERREAFDAAMVVTRDPDGRAMAAAVPNEEEGPSPIVLFDQPGLDGAMAGIAEVLDAFVHDPAPFKGRLDSEASVDLMRKLAISGVELYRAIGRKLKDSLPEGALERLQVVQVDPTAFIPVEFVYDLPAPANDARLCKNWEGALEGKPCTPAHHPVDDALGDLKVVCPSGFWSVSKVIERQVVKEIEAADLKGSRFGIRAEPTERRPRLAPPSDALFAWSDRLDNTVAGASRRMHQALKKATGHATSVRTWREWASTISQRKPSLLVLLSHTTEGAPRSLEIGPEGTDEPAGAERRALGQVNQKLVKARQQDAPVLFLLGCDTAVADRQLYSFVAGFRDAGAAVVIGTITPVHGELAAAVVETLVDQLAAAAKRKDRAVRFGELMREGRRLLLRKGRLTALSAAAFGDADWLVGGKGA